MDVRRLYVNGPVINPIVGSINESGSFFSSIRLSRRFVVVFKSQLLDFIYARNTGEPLNVSQIKVNILRTAPVGVLIDAESYSLTPGSSLPTGLQLLHYDYNTGFAAEQNFLLSLNPNQTISFNWSVRFLVPNDNATNSFQMTAAIYWVESDKPIRLSDIVF